MQLKRYQKRVLNDLDYFMDRLTETNNLESAYAQTWLYNGVIVGNELPRYQNTLTGVPHLCLKVPTGGGKTILACAALKHVYAGLESLIATPIPEKIVVWLVPSNTILEQTLAALQNPDHPYRQQINADFGSRVEVLSKAQAENAQNFTPATVRENLTILVMSFDALRIKKKEGRKAYQEDGALEPFVATYKRPDSLIEDAELNSLMQVLNQKQPVVIVDESHNAQSELSVEMIRNLNPSFVLDLTATPRKSSNVISIVSAAELKRENMIKLPVIVYNRKDRNQVIQDAIHLRHVLELAAKEQEAAGGVYIRPIVLFQAQPNTNAAAATFQHLKEQLKLIGIPEAEIAIKTSEINELKGVDLMSRECQIRYIITVNALKEGWDCPFAYVLASLANRNSRVDVEQIVGRVLRLPYASRQRASMLNMPYVLTSSTNFDETLRSVISGLNQAGFSGRDCRAIDTTPTEKAPDTPQQPVVQPPEQTVIVPPSTTEPPETAQDEDEIDTAGISTAVAPYVAEDTTRPTVTHDPRSPISTMLDEAERQNESMEQAYQDAERQGYEPRGGDEMRKHFPMQAQFEESAKQLVIPQFVQPLGFSLLTGETTALVTKEALSEGFTLRDKDTQISLDIPEGEIARIDLDEYTPRMSSLQAYQKQQLRDFIRSAPKAEQRKTVAYKLVQQLNRINYVPDSELREYVGRIVDNMTSDELVAAPDMLIPYAKRINDKIDGLVDEYRERRFYQRIEINAITAEPQFRFPATIDTVPTMLPMAKSLYTDEGEVDNFERKMVMFLDSLENVVWWHRNNSRKEFCINGAINHYPDFIVFTTSGNVVVIETKGDHLNGSTSARKLKLGRKWADLAGQRFKYYMVFDQGMIQVDGSLKYAEFVPLMKEL